MFNLIILVMYYRADFDITSVSNSDFQEIVGTPLTDSEYFDCDTDENALEHAKWLAEQGTYFADAGHCGLELTYLVEVEDNEFYTEKDNRIVYY